MRYSRRSGVSETPVGDDLFLVDTAKGELFHLDRSARGLWALLDQPMEFAAILKTFSEAFPETPCDQLERDLRNALATLMSRALVITVP
jgi:Coenzyme PQQ synthesis protein D (PqqD)